MARPKWRSTVKGRQIERQELSLAQAQHTLVYMIRRRGHLTVLYASARRVPVSETIMKDIVQGRRWAGTLATVLGVLAADPPGRS